LRGRTGFTTGGCERKGIARRSIFQSSSLRKQGPIRRGRCLGHTGKRLTSFLLPLWEKVAWTKSAPDEGSASAERTPHPSSLREATLSHKGRGDFSDLDFYLFISMPCLADKFENCARLHIGSKKSKPNVW
jgi:hypothetical protein